MSATTVLLCLCGDPKSVHKQGKRACSTCGMCDRFELDCEVPAPVAPQDLVDEGERTRVLTVVAEVCEDHAGKARAELAGVKPAPVALLTPREQGESTSAALARVTAERDEFAERLAATGGERDRANEAARIATQSRQIADKVCEDMRAERDAARAVAEQRNEARAARSWMVARDGGRDCILCGHEIRRGEAYETNPGADELQHVHCPDAEPELAAADVLSGYDAWQCLTCGSRYRHAAEHEHELTPVRVTIARRPAS